MKVINQALLAPVVSAFLYLAVFGVFIGSQISDINGVSYLEFIIPGLVMMNVIMNSYSNTSTSVLISKIFGSIQEILTAPLSYLEMGLAMALAGVVRGVVVGLITLLIGLLLTPVPVQNVLIFAYFMVMVSLIFSSFGILTGLWAEKFEHVTIFSTFLITPLTFLGGVFYSIRLLPDMLQRASVFNPLLYMIDGMRFGMLGVSDVSVAVSMALVLVLALASFAAVVIAFRRGYKLRT